MIPAKLLLGMTCVLICGSAFAQSVFQWSDRNLVNVRNSGHRFSDLDRNQDGFLSREEAAAYPRLAEHFDTMDSDRDGRLSRNELLASRPEKPFGHGAAKLDDRLKSADADSDGALSRSEASSAKLNYLADHFDQFDANRDGKVSRDELRSTFMNHIRPR